MVLKLMPCVGTRDLTPSLLTLVAIQ